MGLPSLAAVDELEIRLGAEVGDVAQAQSLLDYASALIRAYTGQAYVDHNGDLDPADGVEQVCVGMVARALANPDGVVSGQESTGPFQWSQNFGPDAAQRIYLTGADKTILDGKDTQRGKAFTVPQAVPPQGWLG